jgi:hypothetical protein
MVGWISWIFLFLIGCSLCWSILCTEAFLKESSIRFLQLADWGGKHTEPFTTPSQVATAQGMGVIGITFIDGANYITPLLPVLLN